MMSTICIISTQRCSNFIGNRGGPEEVASKSMGTNRGETEERVCASKLGSVRGCHAFVVVPRVNILYYTVTVHLFGGSQNPMNPFFSLTV